MTVDMEIIFKVTLTDDILWRPSVSTIWFSCFDDRSRVAQCVR